MLHDYLFETNNSFEIALVIGNAGITASYVVRIDRAFANMHLSGTKNGGVAFGGFSNSTDDEPLLESYFAALFYKQAAFRGGFDGGTYRRIGNVIYPVGAIFLCADDGFDPNAVFGGAWERVADRFLVGAGGDYAAGDTGGAARVDVGNHSHVSPVARNGNYIGITSSNVNPWPGDVGDIFAVASQPLGAYGSVTRYSTGDAGAHSVDTLPPYLAVCMWKRTALWLPEAGE